MMQDYDITVAVGQSRQLDAPGEYFYYNAGSAGGADSTIYMRGLSSGLRIKLKPGQGFRLPKGTSETSWVITNFAGAATIVGFVTVGDGEITDNRISGDVSIIDTARNTVLSNSAFRSNAYQGPIAGQYSHAGVWNPSTSTKNIAVQWVTLSASAACSIYQRKINAAIGGWSLVTSENLNFYQASTQQHEVRTFTNAAAQGAQANIGTRNFTSGTVDIPVSKFPIVLKPGTGYLLQCDTLNIALSVDFLIEEF